MVFLTVFIALSLFSAAGFFLNAPIIPLSALIITGFLCSFRKVICMFMLGLSESPWTQFFGGEPAYWVWDFIFRNIPFVMLIVFLLADDRTVLLPIYYAITVIPFFGYPIVRFLVKRISAYSKISKVCKSHGYDFKANFFVFLLPKKKIKKPQVTVNTGSEVFDITVLGTVLPCPNYEFLDDTYGTLCVFEPSAAEMLIDRDTASFGDGRKTRFPVSGPKYEVNIPKVDEEHISLLLFDPDYGICVDGQAETLLNRGEDLFGRKTLDIKKLISCLDLKNL